MSDFDPEEWVTFWGAMKIAIGILVASALFMTALALIAAAFS